MATAKCWLVASRSMPAGSNETALHHDHNSQREALKLPPLELV